MSKSVGAKVTAIIVLGIAVGFAIFFFSFGMYFFVEALNCEEMRIACSRLDAMFYATMFLSCMLVFLGSVAVALYSARSISD